MSLKGDLDAHVFQMLSLSEKKGTLKIYAQEARTSLYFNGRGIIFPYDQDSFPEKVVLLLSRSGRIETGAMERATSHAEATRSRLLDVLQEMQAVDEAEVDNAMLEQMEEEIFDLFFVKGATFEFVEGQVPESPNRTLDERYELPAQGLVMEAARRVDEWNYIHERVPSDYCIFETRSGLESFPETEFGSVVDEVYEAIDGFRSVRNLVSQTRLSRFQVSKILALFVQEAIVEEVPAAGLWKRAQERNQAEDLDQCLTLLERAFELGLHKVEAFEMAAQANEKKRQFRRACLYFSLVAESLENDEKKDKAAEIRLHVREIMPTDLATRRQLVAFYMERADWFSNKEFDALQNVVDLVWMLHFVGDFGDARKLLADFHDLDPSHWRKTQRLVQIAVDIGEPKEAVELLGRTADLYRKNETWPQALRLYKQIKSIDPRCPNLEEKINLCNSRMRLSKTRSRRFVRAAVLIAVVGALEAAYLGYNAKAVSTFRGLDPERLAVMGDFPTALQRLEDFRSQYKGTVPSLVASNLIADLEGRRAAFEVVRDEGEERFQEELTKKQGRAESLYTEAQDFFRSGDYPSALEQLERADELASDSAWKKKNALKEKIEEISNYLSYSEDLYQKWLIAFDTSEWEVAHEAAVEIVRGYPLSPRVGDVFAPLRVRCEPDGAVVTWTPQVSGAVSQETAAPALFQVAARARGELRLEKPGYDPWMLEVDPLDQFEHSVRLHRLPAESFQLDEEITQEPLLGDDLLLVGCANGRFTALDPADLTVRWHGKMPALRDVITSPIQVGEMILVGSSDGELQGFDLNGDSVASAEIPARPQGTPVFYRGVMVMPVAGRSEQYFGLAAFNATTVSERWFKEFGGELVTGPIPCEGGFLFSTDAGMVIRIDGRDGSVVDKWRFENPVTALATTEKEIFAGTSGGEVFRWVREGGKPAGLARSPGKGAVRELSVTDRRIHAVVADDLVIFERASGRALSGKSGVVSRIWVFVPGLGYFVRTRESEIVLYGEKELEEQEMYRLPEDPVHAVASNGFPVFLGSRGTVYRLDAPTP